MTILYFLFLYLFAKIISNKYKSIDGEKIFLFFSFVILFLLLALRDLSVGTDTLNYVNYYLYFDYYKNNEIGFFVFRSFLKKIGASYRFYLAIIAFITTIAAYKFIKRYSVDYLISCFAYFSLGLYAMSFSGLRQSLAVCIIMFSIKYIFENKPILFILLIIIASTFHLSSIVFLPVYLLKNIKISKKSILIFIVLAFVFILFNNKIYNQILAYLPDGYLRYSKSNLSINIIVVLEGILIPLVSKLLVNMNEKYNDEKNKYFEFFFNLSILNSLILILSLNNALGDRIALYFSIGNIIIIPYALKFISNKYLKIILYILCIAILSLRFYFTTIDSVLNIDNYKFM